MHHQELDLIAGFEAICGPHKRGCDAAYVRSGTSESATCSSNQMGLVGF